MVKNFTQQSQNFLAVTTAKSLKTCLLPTAAIALSQEKNNFESAERFSFASQYLAMWYSWLSMRQQSWVGLVRFPVGSHRRLVLTVYPSILVLGTDGWNQGNGSCACHH